MANPWIPLAQIYMRQGINIGGFIYRQYTTDGTWDLHLHEGGGIISLHNRAMAQTFYVSTANVDSCDGFPDASKASTDATIAQVAGPLPNGVMARSGAAAGLVPNQVRHEVAAPAVVTIDGPEELLPVNKMTDEQRAAKNAHLAPVSPEGDPNAESPQPAKSPSAYKSLSVPAPAKRRPGRPRKVVMVDPPTDAAPSTNA